MECVNGTLCSRFSIKLVLLNKQIHQKMLKKMTENFCQIHHNSVTEQLKKNREHNVPIIGYNIFLHFIESFPQNHISKNSGHLFGSSTENAIKLKIPFN